MEKRESEYQSEKYKKKIISTKLSDSEKISGKKTITTKHRQGETFR